MLDVTIVEKRHVPFRLSGAEVLGVFGVVGVVEVSDPLPPCEQQVRVKSAPHNTLRMFLGMGTAGL